MNDIDLESRIRSAYAADDEAPPAGGIEPVRARRAAGERGPSAPTIRRRSMLPRLAAIGVAAAAVLLALFYPFNHRATLPMADAPVSASGPASLLLPDPLAAQTTSTPMYAVVDEPLGLRLKPGRWYYGSNLGADSTISTDSLSMFAIERTDYHGQPTWRFVSGRAEVSGPLILRDTTWATRDSLRILARVIQAAPGERLEESYTDSTILRGETHGGFTSWQSQPVHSPSGPDGKGVAIRWYQLTAALQTARLSANWKASLEFRGVIFDGEHSRDFVNIAVIGEQRITVPAGQFDCWMVAFGAPDDAAQNGVVFWISKEQGWIVAEHFLRDGVIWGNMELVRMEEIQ